MAKPTYLTTTLPYVNADPHIGFALELVQADIIARYKKIMGEEVFFNTGTDEHGLKIYRAAEAAGQPVQEYVDRYAKRYLELQTVLNTSTNAFIRTTDPKHVAAAQELWRRCAKDLEKRSFKGLYCVGCEAFIKESDLVDGKCPDHHTPPEEVEEENWFFKVSADYRAKILAYLNQPGVIVPETRRQEALKFVENGFGDFSVSRPKDRLPWGIPVPGDDESGLPAGRQVMYVWFDALTNYISTLGWPEGADFKKFWQAGETIQFAGKDQVRFQSLMWQVMLLSAGIKNTDTVVYHGHITSGGQKMSKSIGNVVNPFDLIEEYGADAVRYFLARHVQPFEDSDFTLERFKEAYNAGLANGLGNLVSRIMQLAQTHLSDHDKIDKPIFSLEYQNALDNFEFNRAMDMIWQKISELDQKITETEPFKLIKSDVEKGTKLILDLILDLYIIAFQLEPFMPETSRIIKESVETNKKPENLFPRKD